MLEEFKDRQLATSLQLQAYENTWRQVEVGKRAATIILPNSDSGEHTVEDHNLPKDKVPEVNGTPNPPAEAKPEPTRATTEETVADAPTQEMPPGEHLTSQDEEGPQVE